MNCNLLIGEEMALKVLKNDAAEEKYRHFLFNDEVKVSIRLVLKIQVLAFWKRSSGDIVITRPFLFLFIINLKKLS